MKGPGWILLVSLLVIVAANPLGVNLAQAGPGTLAGTDASVTPSGGTFYANSPLGTHRYCNAAGVCSATRDSGTALAKFVDKLPGLGSANANGLGQYIPVATPDTTTYSGSDYYEIGLKDYTQKMHTNLPKATKLRGYYQKNGTDHSTQYLGPLILAKTYDPTKTAGVAGNGKPVRIKFLNELGINGAGDLFIPVDTTYMGAGMGPLSAAGAPCDPSLPGATCASYTQNRATIHLHGGVTPWISDGTPHQWITPSGDSTPYKKGVSQQNVPDMPDPNGLVQGSATFYYTNQQSGRLMFYHDHAYGLTRLNVYAGEAAGYLLYDQTEEDFILGTNTSGNNSGLKSPIPNNGGGVYTYGIPLIIQDKTFVPADIAVQDAKWTNAKWGVSGDLWYPHVYETNQWPDNPDNSGANNFGRWDWGPWFWPPVIVDAAHSTPPVYQWDVTGTPEAFMDTMLVNGTAYPYLPVSPTAYRFRILNACNDRPLNLQLYVADPMITTGAGVGKEVPMVTAASRPACSPTLATNCTCNDGTSKPNILWRNTATGQNSVWLMNGIEFLSGQSLNQVPDPNWALVGVGDFNGDGNPDILWRNTATGQNHVWFMNGTEILDGQYFHQVPDLNWKIVGVGDFNSDGKPDILWRNTVTGENHVWFMNGIEILSGQYFNQIPDPNWALVGVGDFNGDGNPDILWRNTATGQDYVWFMNGIEILSGQYFNEVPDLNWKIVGVDAFNAGANSPAGCFPDTWPTDGRAGGVPDPAYAGPKMIQIGTEGGLLPAPVVLNNQPVGYEYNRRTIVVLDILNQTLLLGPAERADVIIDFSAFPGKNVILYNDAPAPNPAFDPRYDYFTGDQDNTWMGGAPTTAAGYGPNTRTIMQFQVASGSATTPYYNDTAKMATLTTAMQTAFNATQPKPIVPQTTYPAPNNVVVGAQYAHIQDNSMTFKPIGGASNTINFNSKAIQELWDPYGRMNATLGVELPFTNNNIQTTIPLGYVDPVTETINNNETQLWKITHNGVDTHPVHFHLFNVQLINRVGWDGAIRPPEPNELGWKETVRMKPLEDVIVGFKAVLPTLPFAIPNSNRLLDPTRLVGTNLTLIDPADGNAKVYVNAMTDFGHEYVWHCHILGHEENDFMRPMILVP
ncbi:MAG: FG-GAP-like repeat-containing protein [Proteobacteria bacterium]|nr:FG-GAP-like repeat-containing protein [Pseudomonadota bacterium]